MTPATQIAIGIAVGLFVGMVITAVAFVQQHHLQERFDDLYRTYETWRDKALRLQYEVAARADRQGVAAHPDDPRVKRATKDRSPSKV
jgi:uncharacterized membrane-anchored protein YhcB (DUF1043 family)